MRPYRVDYPSVVARRQENAGAVEFCEFQLVRHWKEVTPLVIIVVPTGVTVEVVLMAGTPSWIL
jgi:hypothetical protein